VQDPFRQLFQALVNARIELEAHYEKREEATEGGGTETWQAELNVRWDHWARCEQRVRAALSTMPNESAELEEPAVEGWNPLSTDADFQFAT
jgi:hypothetical protein